MLQCIQQGWRTTLRQTPLVLLLFIYQLVWGFFLYKFIQSVVVPLLYRFPGKELPGEATHLYFAEGQFQVMKTDLIHSYLWMLLALFAARMVITPLINAGLYYSIHHEKFHISSFISGIKQMSKPFLFIYWMQMIVTFLPMYWLIPKAKEIYLSHSAYPSILLELAPYILGFLIYSSFVGLWSMYIQFGKTTGVHFFRSWIVSLRHCLPVFGISLLIFCFAGFIALLTITSSMVWAGFFVVILHQAYPLLRTLFKIWEISAQYHLWSAKTQMLP